MTNVMYALFAMRPHGRADPPLMPRAAANQRPRPVCNGALARRGIRGQRRDNPQARGDTASLPPAATSEQPLRTYHATWPGGRSTACPRHAGEAAGGGFRTAGATAPSACARHTSGCRRPQTQLTPRARPPFVSQEPATAQRQRLGPRSRQRQCRGVRLLPARPPPSDVKLPQPSWVCAWLGECPPVYHSSRQESPNARQ